MIFPTSNDKTLTPKQIVFATATYPNFPTVPMILEFSV